MAKADKYADNIIDMYAKMQQNIFDLLIDAVKGQGDIEINENNVMQWQLEQLSKAGMLTDQVIKTVAKVNKYTPAAVKQMCEQLGLEAVKSTQDDIKNNTTKSGNISPDSSQVIDSFINQTTNNLFNNVNETLLTRNTMTNSATRVYRDIVNKSTLEVASGFKTHEQAIRDNVYQWVDKGIPTKLSDSAGRGWSLEAYSRLVVNNSSKRVFNDLRNKTMNVNGVTLAKMSWHPCAREACAPIQGKVVNMVSPESPDYDSKYDSIYNHRYGEPSGVQGINCGHIFTPFDPEINIDHKDSDVPTPEEAIKQSGIQQKQRSMERAIRQTKKKMAAAERLGDTDGLNHFKSTLSNQQARLRGLISNNKFLSRDYSREQIFDKRKPFSSGVGKVNTPKPITPIASIKEPKGTNITPGTLMKGVTLGKPMEIEQADKTNANPNYWGSNKADRQKAINLKREADGYWDEYLKYYEKFGNHMTAKFGISDEEKKKGQIAHNNYSKTFDRFRELTAKAEPYHVNCQRCAPAYELRRRGYNVTALPNDAKFTDKETYDVPAKMWLNEDGSISKPEMLKARKNRVVTKELDKRMKVGERGTLDWSWTHVTSGHIINVEKTKEGLLFVDAQGGRTAKTFEEYMDGNKFRTKMATFKMGVNYNRVDDKKIDLDNIGLVVTKNVY